MMYGNNQIQNYQAASAGMAGGIAPIVRARGASFNMSPGAALSTGMLPGPQFELGAFGIAQRQMWDGSAEPRFLQSQMYNTNRFAGNGMLPVAGVGGQMMPGMQPGQVQPTWGLMQPYGLQQMQSVWGQGSNFGQALMAAAVTQKDIEEREQYNIFTTTNFSLIHTLFVLLLMRCTATASLCFFFSFIL